MERLDIDNILKMSELNNELEYEKAVSIYGRLRWMIKEDSSLLMIKEHLKTLIKDYEEKYWNDESLIDDKRVKDSDLAERIISRESEFIENRKKLIKEKLKEAGLTQHNLAEILGHRPNYMSELINGVRPFSRDDIVVIHRLFGIELKYLIPPFIKAEVVNHIKHTLKELKLKKPKIKLKDLETV